MLCVLNTSDRLPRVCDDEGCLNATGRPIFFSLCGWEPWYAPMGRRLGNSWRIGTDDGSWPNILTNINNEAYLSSWSGPGGWNDPCLLVSKMSDGTMIVTERQSRTQFNMWAIMSAPLLISGDVRKISPYTLQTYMNDEVISVNQDVLGRQGMRLVGSDLILPKSDSPSLMAGMPMANLSSVTNVWSRPLADGSWAVAFLNIDTTAHTVACPFVGCLQAMGMLQSDKVNVRDLWRHADVSAFQAANGLSMQIEPNGGSTMVKLTVVAF